MHSLLGSSDPRAGVSVRDRYETLETFLHVYLEGREHGSIHEKRRRVHGRCKRRKRRGLACDFF